MLTDDKETNAFRFTLSMDKVRTPGYISEKIVAAFVANTVPIYYGTTEVFKLFNKDAFIYYDIANPQPALDRILYLAQGRFTIGTPDEVLRDDVLSGLYGTSVEVIRSRGRVIVVGVPDGDHHHEVIA